MPSSSRHEVTMRRPDTRPGRRQRGAVTLLVGMMLLMASSILTLGVIRGGLMEQRMANNELRANEVHQAAQAGLDYALAWLTLNVWSTNNPIPASADMTATGDYSYHTELTVVDSPGCLRVTSQAQAVTDANITATLSECYQQKRLLQAGIGADSPPLVVNGCLSGITNGPDVYPIRCDLTQDAGCLPIAVASSQPASCLNPGGLGLNGGVIKADAFEGSAWDYVFAADRQTLQALAAQPDSNVHWITSSHPWHESLGSASAPAILIFDESAGCPKVNGNPILYGIVYFAKMGGCSSQGWGGADVNGTVVFEGPLQKLTANSEFRHWSHAGDDDERAELNPVQSTHRVPGSWRDWEPE